MTSQVKAGMLTKLTKEDIGHPTDFRHVAHQGLPLADEPYRDLSLVEKNDAGLPLADEPYRDLSLVEENDAGVSLVNENVAVASNTQTETDTSAGNNEKLIPAPTPPTVTTKPPTGKRKAPKPPPNNTNATKPNNKPNKVFGAWRGLLRKPAPPPPTLQQENQTPARKAAAPPAKLQDTSRGDAANNATARTYFRKAPPVPTKSTPLGTVTDKTSESISNIQSMAAMMTLKLINRYPDDYMEDETVFQADSQESENLIDLVEVSDSNTFILDGSIYEDIPPRVEDEVTVARSEVVSLETNESVVDKEALARTEVVTISTVAEEKSVGDEQAKVRLDIVTLATNGRGQTEAEESGVLLRGGASQASTRRRNSALNALDTVIMSFVDDLEEEEEEGETGEQGTTSEIRKEEESIYEDIEILNNIEPRSPEPPQVLPRTFSKENILAETPPKLPPKPAPRKVLQTSEVVVQDEAVKQRLSEYLEEFYEYVAPQEDAVSECCTRDNVDEELIQRDNVRGVDVGTGTVEVNIEVSSLNCVVENSVTNTLVDLVENKTMAEDTASVKEKSAELKASLNDSSDEATAMSSERKHSILTWTADKSPTLDGLGDRGLKLLLMKAGVTDVELQDKATRDFILQFINEHGGKDRVKMEAMFLTTLAARPNRRRHKKKLTEVVNIAIDGSTQREEEEEEESTYM